jgi:YbbR domain-containing protein
MEVSVQPEGNQPNNYYKAQAVPNPSYVKITGPRSIVNSADIAVATINIDGAIDTVVRTVPVRVYDDMDNEIFFSVPTGNVEVTVPIYPTKYVPLKPMVVGVPEEGYEMVNVTVKPERVRIAAKQDVLDTITELPLEELDITGTFNNILTSKNILNIEGLILLDLETSPVINTVVEKIIDREFTFTKDDIQFINISDNTDVIMEENEEDISVIVSGTSTLINSLNKDDIILTVDLAEKTLGMNTVNLGYVSEFTFKNIIISKATINVEIIETEAPESSE